MTIPVCDQINNFYNMVSPCFFTDYNSHSCGSYTNMNKSSYSDHTALHNRVSFSDPIAEDICKQNLQGSQFELNNEVSFGN